MFLKNLHCIYFPQDGVVLAFEFITGYNRWKKRDNMFDLGRTATHEVGHYLGLDHIWMGGCKVNAKGDRINDTPRQKRDSSGCPKPGRDTCPGGNGLPDMTMNYMVFLSLSLSPFCFSSLSLSLSLALSLSLFLFIDTV